MARVGSGGGRLGVFHAAVYVWGECVSIPALDSPSVIPPTHTPTFTQVDWEHG